MESCCMYSSVTSFFLELFWDYHPCLLHVTISCFHCCIATMTISQFICSSISGFFTITGNAAVNILPNYNVSCVGRGHVCFILCCFLEQCLTQGRCSINIWGMNNFLYLSPVHMCKNCFRMIVFKGWSKDPLRSQRPFQRASKDKTTFI